MPSVVIDTCEIYRDYNLSNPLLMTVVDFCKDNRISFIIPETVLMEHINHFDQEVIEKHSSAKKYARLIAASGISKIEIPKKDDVIDSFNKKIRQRATELGAVIAPPDLDSKKLVQKMLRASKPFKANRTGLADEMLWQTVMMLAHKRKVYFISSNKHDFCDSSGQLHSDLAAEAKRAGIAENKIVYFSSLHDFVERHIFPFEKKSAEVEKYEALASDLEAGKSELLDLHQWVDANFDRLDVGRFWTGWDIGVPVEYDDSEFEDLDEVHEIYDVEVTGSGNDNYLINFVAGVELNYVAFAHSSDVYDNDYGPSVEILQEFGLYGETVLIRAQVDCTAEIALRVNKKTGAVDSEELVSLK